MSEVKRFDCTNGRAQHCYGCYQMDESAEGDYVSWADFDAQRLRADTAEAELAKGDEGMRAIACSLGAGGYNAESLTADQLVAKVQWGIDELLDVHERRMTTAVQRIAELKGLILDLTLDDDFPEHWNEAYAIDAALNPNPEAESQ